MPDRSPVPLADEILGPGIDAIVSVRGAQILRFLNNNPGSVYARVFAGWRAQIALLIAYLADEVKSARLPLAEAQALVECAADEFFTIVDPAATKAYGTVFLTRTGTLPGGVIRKGTTFRRAADETKLPKVRAASWSAIGDTVYPPSQSTIAIDIIADIAGTAANAPMVDGAVRGTLRVSDSLFDPLITVVSYDSAGGTDGIDDTAVRAEASAYARGQYAASLDAILAGALRGTGARHASVQEVSRATTGVIPGYATSPNCAYTNVAIADASWASSAKWMGRVKQAIAEKYKGFGGSFNVASVSNLLIRVDATITLRDSKYFASTADIDAAIQKALTDYFDGVSRPDWWTWKLPQIRAVIARADRRILTCTTAAVRSLSDATVSATPTVPLATYFGMPLTHYMMTDNALVTTYLSPS